MARRKNRYSPPAAPTPGLLSTIRNRLSMSKSERRDINESEYQKILKQERDRQRKAAIKSEVKKKLSQPSTFRERVAVSKGARISDPESDLQKVKQEIMFKEVGKCGLNSDWSSPYDTGYSKLGFPYADGLAKGMTCPADSKKSIDGIRIGSMLRM